MDFVVGCYELLKYLLLLEWPVEISITVQCICLYYLVLSVSYSPSL